MWILPSYLNEALYILFYFKKSIENCFVKLYLALSNYPIQEDCSRNYQRKIANKQSMTCYLFWLAALATPQPKRHRQPCATCFFDGRNSQLQFYYIAVPILEFRLLNIVLNPNTFQVISQKLVLFLASLKISKYCNISGLPFPKKELK